jgi:HSP20 family protein
MSTAIATKPNMSNKTAIQFPQTVNFLDELEALNRETAKRAFALFQQRSYMNGWDLDDWLRAESEILRPVPIEMSEADDSYTIRAEVPGFDARNITIQADGNSVYIRGKNEHKKEERKGGDIKYSELSATELCRRIALPSSIDPERITARLTGGVLELTLPKAAPPKTVEVKAA